jgi:hypothetical protein
MLNLSVQPHTICSASHYLFSLTHLSSDPEYRYDPSLLWARLQTDSSWPRSVWQSTGGAEDNAVSAHTRIVLSPDPLKRMSPHGPANSVQIHPTVESDQENRPGRIPHFSNQPTLFKSINSLPGWASWIVCCRLQPVGPTAQTLGKMSQVNDLGREMTL